MGSTIGEALGWNGFECDPQRLLFFKEMVRERWDRLMSGHLEADDIKVFVKQEPHKTSKLREGRYRLISAVSVVDTMIDRILFSHWHRLALEKVGRTPCLMGWNPVGGGFRWLERRFAGKGKKVSLDKSAWDWTVTKKFIRLWYWFVVGLPINAPTWWKQMVYSRFCLLYRDAWFRFSDGARVQQPGWGVQKSGCFLTLILNSVGQSMAHYIANFRLGLPPRANEPWAIGDDTLQEDFPELQDYLKQLSALGLAVKESQPIDWIDFAGFIIKDDLCWPAYWQKHCYKIRKVSPSVAADTLDAYQRLYAYEPVMLELIQYNLGLIAPERVIPAWLLQRNFEDS